MASDVTAASMTVKWNPPDTPNGVISSYKVTWSPDDDTADTAETSYTISGLLACSTYSITVSAGNSKGYGPPGDISKDTLPAGISLCDAVY